MWLRVLCNLATYMNWESFLPTWTGKPGAVRDCQGGEAGLQGGPDLGTKTWRSGLCSETLRLNSRHRPTLTTEKTSMFARAHEACCFGLSTTPAAAPKGQRTQQTAARGRGINTGPFAATNTNTAMN